MAAKAEKQEGQGAPESEKTTFKCPFCQEPKPLDEMRMLTRFFPIMLACRDCEKKIQ